MPSKQADTLTQTYIDNLNTSAQEFIPPPSFIRELAEFTGLSRTTVNRWFGTTTASRALVPGKYVNKTRRHWDTSFKDSDRKRLLLAQLIFDSLERKAKYAGDPQNRTLESEGGTLMEALKMGWETTTRDRKMKFYSAAFTSLSIEVNAKGKYVLKLSYTNKLNGENSDDINEPASDLGPDEEEYFSPLEVLEGI